MTPHDPAGTDPAGAPVRLLLVEDEAPVRAFLRAGLSSQGVHLLEAATGEEGLRMAAEWAPEAVLLDLGLPDMDGLDFLARFREWSRAPVIVLSARGREEQKVAALDSGADDFVTKPFGMRELVARLRAALRRAAAAPAGRGTVFQSGGLRVDLPRRLVTVDDRPVHLTPIEYRMLLVLVTHAGRVVTHRQMLLEVWGPHGEGRNHYLRVHMAHLRRKIEKDASRPRLLHTEAGVGYRLAEGT